MPNVKLETSDGEILEVDHEIVKCSRTIKSMLEELKEDKEEDKVVSLPTIGDSAILKKVMEWATYHKDDPPLPEDDENTDRHQRSDDISAWDAEFLEVDRDTLFKIMLAAHELDMMELRDVMFKTYVNMIKGKPKWEILESLNIK